MVPVYIPAVFFHKLQRVLTAFIWALKCPWLSRKVLPLPKNRGSVTAPGAALYYQASVLKKDCRLVSLSPRKTVGST